MTVFSTQIDTSTDDAADLGHPLDPRVFDDDDTTYVISDSLGDTLNIAGFRFPDVTIPQGSTINSATLTIHVRLVGMGNSSFDLWGVDADDLATWSSGSNRPEDVTQTTAVFNFSETGEFAEQPFDFPVASIIQEIVDRGGWSSGNGLGFVTEDKGSASRNYMYTMTLDNAHEGAAAVLTVNYTAPSTGRRVFVMKEGVIYKN